MADKICSLHIINKKPKTRVLGKSIAGPHFEGLVHFYTSDQVMYARKLEEDKESEIKSDIPSHILEEIEKKKEQSFGDGPLNQVRNNFNGHVPIGKNQEGWNSPNDAYKGEDLADREGGFASTSPVATEDDSDKVKITPDGEEVEKSKDTKPDSAWNSPDDAYQGEDLKDRINDSIEELEESIGDVARETEERMQIGPQDQTGDQATEQKPNVDDDTTEGTEDGEKPSWYLEYDAVEDMTKQELIDWSEKQVPEEEGLKLKSSDTAAATKENVHNFLSGKFPDHTA